MVDIDKVVQAFAVQVYTQTLDLIQQLHPLTPKDVDQYEKRVDGVIAGVSKYLLSLTEDDLYNMQNKRIYIDKKLDLQGTTAHDIEDGVQMVIEMRIRSAVRMCVESGIDAYKFIKKTGEYLRNPDDHKRGWLAERAGNLLVAGVSNA